MTPDPKRWWIIILIAIVTVINYVDRTSLSVMWTAVSADLQLSKEDYASIVSMFMVMYGLGQAGSGRVFDKLGTRVGFVLFVAVWSLACMGHGMAGGLAGLLGLRAVLGFSEAGNWPGGTKAVAEWFPRQERALAQGIFNAGSSFGAVISAPLIALLFSSFGWRPTFILLGVLGFVWTVPWWIGMRGATAPAQETATGIAGEDRALTWREIFSHRQAWGIFMARFFMDPIWWLFVNWLPILLAERFGFDIKSIGLFAWVPYLGAVIGSIGGGWLAGFWMKRGWSVNRARKTVITLGAAMTLPGFVLAAITSDPLTAVLAMALVLCGFQVAMNNIQTLPSDFFSGKSVGTASGMGGLFAVLGVLVFSTWLVPVISQVSYLPVFVMGSLFAPCGLVMLVWLCGEVRPLETRGRRPL
ncbi:MAG: MFS transporter [Opitutaceae bacterium]|nr:MFS transporter [Opitutaceae bacterium]